MNGMIKKCPHCGKEKSVSEFHKDKYNNDGLATQCKICVKVGVKKYYDSHRKQRLAYAKKYREENKEKLKKDLTIYRATHKKEINTQQRNYCIKRRNEDIEFKLSGNLRNRIRLVLKRNTKSGHTLELLGCSTDFLKKHLESQFVDDMSWDNYGIGGWVIDHIKPCASFDLSNSDEQCKCFHYSNLQPLWEKDNLDKRSTDNKKYGSYAR